MISWHELTSSFFAEWTNRYDDCRGIESSLGLPAREICINEYGRNAGDLGVPGKLVQWMARFEASKVDACLAYWTTAGCLDDLVARDEANRATGGWWLYRWYGGLTGHTVQVTPPDAQPKGCTGWRPSTARKSRRVSCSAAAAAAPTSWLRASTRRLTGEARSTSACGRPRLPAWDLRAGRSW